MEETTYTEILSDLNLRDKPKYKSIVDTFKNWKLTGGKEIIDNVSADYIVFKAPLEEVIEHLLIFKNLDTWSKVKKEYGKACESRINKFCNKGKITNSQEYSKYLGRGFKSKEVSRCVTVNRFISTITTHDDNPLGEDEQNDFRERIQSNTLEGYQKNVLKFKMGRPYFPIWVTFVGNKETFSKPLEFANGHFKHYQLRICLGLSPSEDSLDQIAFTYSLKSKERLRYPTVIDANNYDFFRPVDIKENPQHGYTANSSNSDEIFFRLLLSDTFKKMFEVELNAIEAVKADSKVVITEKEKAIKSINDTILTKIDKDKFMKCRPEAVYYSDNNFSIADLIGYELTKS